MRRNFRRGALSALWFAAATLHALQAGAQDKADYDRTAPYLIVGGGYSFENFSNSGAKGVDPSNVIGAGPADDNPNVIFHAGWRVHPHVAVDVGFEWNPGFDAKPRVRGAGNVVTREKTELETYLTTVGMKLYALKGRFKPFLHPSIGVMVARFTSNIEGTRNETKTTPALRGGGGIEIHASERLFLHFGVYYVLPTDDDVKDAQYIPVVGGIGWRF